MAKLTATAVKNAKPDEKPYKLSDGNSLFLIVNPASVKKPEGSKLWRFNYRYNGKQKQLALGVYPEISLLQARKLCTEARELLAEGIDPSTHKQAIKREKRELASNSFEAVAREWIGKQKNRLSNASITTITRHLENNVFPWIGKRPITEVTAPELLSALRKMEERGILETAHRVRATCGQVFRYAIATGKAERDVAADLRGALEPVKQRHLAAVTDPKEVAELLRAIDSLSGSMEVRCAMRLAPLVFVRPGELRKAEWSEIDFENKQWNISAEKMKMKQPHIVPLSDQAISILQEIHPLTSRSRYVFPSARSAARPMSDMALLAAMARMGYKDRMTPHGFRAMARTLLDEVLQQRVDFIEHQLAHAVKDPNGRAYNRTSHLEGRRKMMQVWADYLDGLKQGAQVIPFKAKA